MVGLMRPPAPHGGPSDNNTPRQPKYQKIANKYFMTLFLLVIIFPAEEVKLQLSSSTSCTIESGKFQE